MSKYETLWNYINNSNKNNITLSFDEINKICGVPIDHSFLNYKNELTKYSYEVSKISIKSQMVTFERKAKNNTLVLYVHGKGGTAYEAEHYQSLFPYCEVVGLDYKSETPWEAKTEFSSAFQTLSDDYNSVILIANSIGAYFSMCALPQEKIKKTYFISPIVDMEKLICNMMKSANVTENDLREKGTIETEFGETLSWKYLCYVRRNPFVWKIPTEILYGGQDNLTDLATITAFANDNGANLTVMENGEHWFHTAEQMIFLDNWISGNIKLGCK